MADETTINICGIDGNGTTQPKPETQAQSSGEVAPTMGQLVGAKGFADWILSEAIKKEPEYATPIIQEGESHERPELVHVRQTVLKDSKNKQDLAGIIQAGLEEDPTILTIDQLVKSIENKVLNFTVEQMSTLERALKEAKGQVSNGIFKNYLDILQSRITDARTRAILASAT